jgi:deoxyribonuclease-4
MTARRLPAATTPRPDGAPPDLLGAHVSTQGGVDRAPERGRAIGATAIQVFTKPPSRWREPALTADTVRRFRDACAVHRIAAVTSHDSYLINLASPDAAMRRRSEACLTGELRRCEALGIRWVVSHPGNYLDDRRAGLARNAKAYARCLDAVDGAVRIAIETTAGSGTALGSRFEELAALVDGMPAPARDRIAFCADTCHLWAAGYDLVDDFDGVWDALDRHLGRERLAVLHLNDAKGGRGSRLDRHEQIGQGRLGREVFRRIMTEARFRGVIKVIETPKGDDMVTNDRRALRRLRAWSRGNIGVLQT